MSQDTHVRPRAVLITGAGGYIGRQLVADLALDEQHIRTIVATDIDEIAKPAPNPGRLPGSGVPKVHYVQMDVRSPRQADLMAEHAIDSVVHLASVVTPGPEMTRAFLYDVEVAGTENIIHSCLQAGVRQLVITSSGAAYGYHPDNPQVLEEDHPLRGNPEFAYSDHKRQVEELLARYRHTHPGLKQLIFRPGTILGATARNQITALFEKPVVLGVTGAPAPFVFIWDRDVVACLHKGIRDRAQGIYNLAGDGTLSLAQIARHLGKPYLPLPAAVLQAALRVLARWGVTRYGPEQVGFLQYRPVLSNQRLKTCFGYTPQKTTREAFEFYWATRKQ